MFRLLTLLRRFSLQPYWYLILKTVPGTSHCKDMSVNDAKFTWCKTCVLFPRPFQFTVLHLMSIENSNFVLLFPRELLAKQYSDFDKIFAAISLVCPSAAFHRFYLHKNVEAQQKRQKRKTSEASFILIMKQVGC